MRLKVLAATLTVLLSFPGTISSQQTAPTPTQAAVILSQSLSALGGSTNVSDVTLTGTAERIAGSYDETGTVTYRAVPTANRLDLSLSGGAISEIRSPSSAGRWIGTDGTSHGMAVHNVMIDPGWFPLFTIASINSYATTVVSYVGAETRNGTAVIHLSASQQLLASAGPHGSLAQHLTAVDIYVDATSFLPVSYIFSIHPDSDALVDSPMEIRYGGYQNFGGVQIPLHVQEFLNNSLVLDLHFQNASLNTGLTTAQLGIQAN